MRGEREIQRGRETGQANDTIFLPFLLSCSRESFLHQILISFFLKFVFIFNYVHVSILRFAAISAGDCGGQKRTSDTGSWSYKLPDMAPGNQSWVLPGAACSY